MQQPLDKILIYRNSNEFSTESLLQNVIAQHQKIKTNDMFGDIRTIKYDPRFSKNSIALSANTHHLHTDGSFCKFPPPCFLLYFEETDPHGGVSTFLPVTEMLAAMPAAFLQAITESNFCITRHVIRQPQLMMYILALYCIITKQANRYLDGVMIIRCR